MEDKLDLQQKNDLLAKLQKKSKNFMIKIEKEKKELKATQNMLQEKLAKFSENESIVQT